MSHPLSDNCIMFWVMTWCYIDSKVLLKNDLPTTREQSEAVNNPRLSGNEKFNKYGN